MKTQRLALGQRVADAELAVVGDADDVAGPGVLGELAVAGEEEHRVRHRHRLAGADVVQLHAALEVARAEPEEGDPVAVLGVHVGLDLEDEAGDLRLPGADRARLGGMGLGRRAEAADAGHQLLHAEGVDRRAEPDRREVAVEHRLVVEGGQERARHLDLLAQGGEQIGRDQLGHPRVVEALHLHALGAAVAVGAVHQLQPVAEHVVAADEVAALADRPGGRADVELQLVLDLVDDREGVARLAVHLVAEGQDRQIPEPADLEELAGLALDALGAVDDHDRGVDRGQRAVGVLGEVGVAGGVDEVEPPVAEREGHRARRRRRCRAPARAS